MGSAMQRLQILFPDPLMETLRRFAKLEDRPVSEIVRRAVDRDLEQRAPLLARGGNNSVVFPTFDGGKVLVTAARMKSVIHGDDS
jgi:metal-responsive CopG/Arc/MetJ family transcriptional regulator